MTFFEKVLNLIQENEITKNKLVQDLGLSRNAFVDWKNRGNIPSGEILSKIADYFNVSTDYLLGRSEQISNAKVIANEPSITPQEQSLLENYKKLNTIGKEKADEYIVDLTEQDKYTRHEKRQEKLNA